MFGLFSSAKTQMVTADTALPGRAQPILDPGTHHVSGVPIGPPYPAGSEVAIFGMGCFWGAERAFWEAPGVIVTAAGYAGGFTPNPTYEEVCTGRTGHSEVVQVVFDPVRTSYDDLLRLFWEAHDPTQGMRQGNDVGTQYRSFIGTFGVAQAEAARRSEEVFAADLRTAGLGAITTDIVEDPVFYFAEDYHQQYLSKNPHGYCGLQGTGVACALPPRRAAEG